MSILLVRSVTLEGASIGLMRYITPDWDKIWDSETWIDSATQVTLVLFWLHLEIVFVLIYS